MDLRGVLATALLLLVQVGLRRQHGGVFGQDISFEQPEKIVNSPPDSDSPGRARLSFYYFLCRPFTAGSHRVSLLASKRSRPSVTPS
ncbi:hypothetical protein LSAT2_032392 [Lamellibrachia satsuma]|nr:hypothetical protein LSAT2_032392 [Lamellibrachia satsuma]